MTFSLSFGTRRPRASEVPRGRTAAPPTVGANDATTEAKSPSALAYPEFRCPKSGLLLTDPVLDAHGRSYQRGKFVGGALVPNTGVDPRHLAQPVMEDTPTRRFVGGALAGASDHTEAFECPISLEVPKQPVAWRGLPVEEPHVFERAKTEKFFDSKLHRSPTTGLTITSEIAVIPHQVAAAYSARVYGRALEPPAGVAVMGPKVPPLAPPEHMRALLCVLYGAGCGAVAGCVLSCMVASPWRIPALALAGAATGAKQSWGQWSVWTRERRESAAQQQRHGDNLV